MNPGVNFNKETIKTEMTQIEAVLEYLQAGNPITPSKAQTEFGVWRLAAVIYKLRNRGYDIETINKRSFTGKQYAEYRLATLF